MVGFLHCIIKDYAERPDVWPKLLAVTDKQFSPQARLCNAHVIKLKIGNRGLFPESKIGSKFWDLTTCAMEHASRADPDCSKGIQPKLLGELDTVATHLVALKDQENLTFLEYTKRTRQAATDWSETRAECSINRCFLHLLVQYRFHDCVQFMISTMAKKLDQELLDQALQVAIWQQDNSADDSCHEWDDRPDLIRDNVSPAMVKLLENGAYPNVRFSLPFHEAGKPKTAFSSPWGMFLQIFKPEGESSDELGMLFLQFGADLSFLGKEWKCCKKVCHEADEPDKHATRNVL